MTARSALLDPANAGRRVAASGVERAYPSQPYSSCVSSLCQNLGCGSVVTPTACIIGPILPLFSSKNDFSASWDHGTRKISNVNLRNSSEIAHDYLGSPLWPSRTGSL